MIVGVPVESNPGESRVSIVPAAVPLLTKAGLEVLVESGAGNRSGYPNDAYVERGVKIAGNRDELFGQANVVVCVSNPQDAPLRSGQVLFSMLNPLGAPEALRDLAGKGVTAFALELLPRITRAQPMDVLSSMATVTGYKAVLLAADQLDKMFPLMMTAAGTVTPANAFIIGAGVAGLQAIATARRLGAIVLAYDVRPAVKEQVESLGGKFLEIPLTGSEAEGEGGYAKAMDEDFYRRQREAMTEAIASSDVVITTAAIPGKKAPVLVTAEMVKKMRPGSVIVDLAAETGGNCELTKTGENIDVDGVRILGPVNVPSMLPRDASQMYARNVTSFLQLLVKNGELNINMDDEIITGTLATKDGEVVNERVKEILAEKS